MLMNDREVMLPCKFCKRPTPIFTGRYGMCLKCYEEMRELELKKEEKNT